MKTEQFGEPEEEKRYWESFDAADLKDDEEVKVRVKKPLRHILTIRMDDADLIKLQTLAAIQGIGVTTYARDLLRAVLERPDQQLFLHALRQKKVRDELESLMGDSASPPGSSEPDFFVLSGARLRELSNLISQTCEGMLRDMVQKGPRVSPQDEVYRKLESLEEAAKS